MHDQLQRIDDNRLRVPKGYRPGMRTDGVIYVDATLQKDLEAASVEQIANIAALPGIVGNAMAMPDVHKGYGFPIGGVAAFDLKEGVISPGGVGYDINCGVRLVRSNLTREAVLPQMRDLIDALYNAIPSGVGSKGRISLGEKDREQVLLKGARWAVEQGYGDRGDLERIESGGCMDGADPSLITAAAYDRGKSQQGTLGSGNHFLEVQYVDEIYDEAAAGVLGLFPHQITLMIHTGSRGFGHQVCTDFLALFGKAAAKYGIVLPDRELACAPFASSEGQDYFGAMKASANYAWANRQCLMHWAREVFRDQFRISPAEAGMSLIYDVAHNIAKIEEHTVNGRLRKVLVHRKGCTRAFPPGHPELPARYRGIGQPVLLPGDMGRASYVMLGTETAMAETFGSTSHGAGRLMSRGQAIRQAKGRAIWRELEDQGILVRAAGRETLAEEMPEAYKNIASVVGVIQRAGISKKVARLRPLGVIKG